MINNTSKSKKAGFTLIELLVVIAIISLLSAIVIASLSTAKTKANNAAIVQEMVQIRTALNLYANDHDGSYPLVPTGPGPSPLLKLAPPNNNYIASFSPIPAATFFYTYTPTQPSSSATFCDNVAPSNTVPAVILPGYAGLGLPQADNFSFSVGNFPCIQMN